MIQVQRPFYKSSFGPSLQAFPFALVATLLGIKRLIRSSRKINFRNRVALVTGGSRGLGLILAQQLAAQGAKVIICSRKAKELAEAEQILKGINSEVMSWYCDVSQGNQVREMIQSIAFRFGRLDILINNAGIIQVGPLENMTKQDFVEAMKVNFEGTLNTTLSALPYLSEGSRIVNITSIGGAIAIPHLLPYTTSKFAQLGFSLGLGSELAKQNIQVTTVVPGLMRTGSFLNAFFKGKARAEFNWFSMGASLPVLSLDAERAAKKILSACQYGVPFITLGVPFKLARIAYSLFPGLGESALSAVNSILPGQGESDLKAGKEIQSSLKISPSLRLGIRAAQKFKEAG